MSDLARWQHRVYARVLGYFWTPCPLCGEPFGGHEWRSGDTIPAASDPDDPPGTERGEAICPSCGDWLRAHAAEMCAVDGHTYAESWTADPRGEEELLRITLDRKPDRTFCADCGVDLPRLRRDDA